MVRLVQYCEPRVHECGRFFFVAEEASKTAGRRLHTAQDELHVSPLLRVRAVASVLASSIHNKNENTSYRMRKVASVLASSLHNKNENTSYRFLNPGPRAFVLQTTYR